ncbi:putative methyl-accepting chemotaxis protein (plasmid) [Rhizobium etli CFN 42]|uniref:Methyl-accepting chemotaxis protein n=1 Tax=Rhizobium etli (strain ATCC 51251 / DSM 11541 / JCM 21823 / NBRC 15573 / CFN 42) TaxID=347834 RepID=Q2JYG0_RHIEC|nr:putative methyl-accepting chemotaxis protein [Rhizobium etli CFN 42]
MTLAVSCDEASVAWRSERGRRHHQWRRRRNAGRLRRSIAAHRAAGGLAAGNLLGAGGNCRRDKAVDRAFRSLDRPQPDGSGDAAERGDGGAIHGGGKPAGGGGCESRPPDCPLQARRRPDGAARHHIRKPPGAFAGAGPRPQARRRLRRKSCDGSCRSIVGGVLRRSDWPNSLP